MRHVPTCAITLAMIGSARFKCAMAARCGELMPSIYRCNRAPETIGCSRAGASHQRDPQHQRQLTRLINYFLKGLVFLAPLAFTIYICVRIFTTIDGWLGFSMPGAGFAITVVLITMVGFLAQSFLTRGVLSIVESMLNRLPFVRLLYSSTKDLLN